MSEFKKGTAAHFLIRMIDTTGADVPALAFGDVTATLARADGTTLAVTPADAAHWIELTAGAWSGKGCYILVVEADASAVAGCVGLAVTSATAECLLSPGDVVDQLESDTYARLGAPAGASIAADVAAVQTVAPSSHFYVDQETYRDHTTRYGTVKLLLSARKRYYDTAAHATTHGATGLLRTVTITCTYDSEGTLTGYLETSA